MTVLVLLLLLASGAGRAGAIVAPVTMPTAQYVEEHRTGLFTLDTSNATWHPTGQVFPTMQLCVEFADELDARAPTPPAVYDCRWIG
jgi:hypothetical protein